MKHPTFDSLEGRAFIHLSEDSKKVEEALREVFRGDIELDRESLEEGFEVLSIGLEEKVKNRAKEISERLSEKDREAIVKGLDRRVDETGNFFLKLDKQAAYNGELKISRDKLNGIIWISIAMTSYPSRKEKYVNELEKIFKP